jgi:hypothetical protein
MTMRSFLFALCAASLLAAGCRQPDGALPADGPDEENRRYDVGRDLQNIAGGDTNGPQEFADDVQVWATSAPGDWPPSDELARRVTVALKGKTLSDEAAAQLSRFFWIAAAGRELSDRQVERLQEDLTAALLKLGAEEAAAKAVADQIAEVQKAVTVKQRRWYQLF